MTALLGLLGLLATALLTGTVRAHAIRSNLLDHPNERSSHVLPTPRGGGAAIVAVFLALSVGLGISGRLDVDLCAALIGGGLLVAALGYLDDRHTLPARWRFLGHALATAWVLAWAMPLPPVPILGVTLDLGPLAVLLSALFMVWMINLFNFMDGIDGIASIEAITVALGGALLCTIAAPTSTAATAAIVFAGCVAGFLWWNYPPARIFMGDAGSGFLGFVLAALALWSSREASHLFWAWFVLLGAFMVDATTTLVRRVRRGDKFYEAHRSHAYQYAARRHGSHQRVTLAYGLVTLFWLLPWAVAVSLQRVDGVVAVALSYAPLIALAFRYKAGDRQAQDG